ncbi:carbonic anhydrase-like [Parasteatoda tepidariorum]|uniref:carbonic anhydrase-like n=1 Tax=Parasteatoda tepidariorum TaxID=114398 RepID=UPI0039BCE392
MSPKYWGETFPACNGRKQSPIDIVTADVVKDKNLERLQLTNYDKPLTRAIYENNGNSSCLICCTNNNDSPFIFKKMTIPLVQRNTYPSLWLHAKLLALNDILILQLHFVHTDAKGRIAVVGVFFKSTIFNNTGMRPISDMLQSLLYKGTELDVKGDINLDKLVKNGCSYYRYDGSLTTPGCDEGVIWIIFKNPLRIGFLQLTEFRQVYSVGKTNGVDISECKITGNHRPIQPINSRTIRSSV